MNDLWEFVDQQRALIPEPIDRHEDQLNAEFHKLEVGLQKKISNGYFDALKLLNSINIWEACSLIVGMPCGDDSFLYFRNWIIWHGQALMLAVINNPDDLASVIAEKNIKLSNPFVEALGFFSECNSNVSSDFLNEEFSNKWDSKTSSSYQISQKLPKLWALYGEKFSWDLPPSIGCDSVSITGLGIVKKGEKVRHLKGYGVGIVVEFPIAGRSVAVIDFSDGRRTIDISAEWFSKE